MKRTIFSSAMLIAGAILTNGKAENIGVGMMIIALILALASPIKKLFLFVYSDNNPTNDS